MRTIGVVTVGRSDYGIYQSILQRIQSDRRLRLWLYVGGMHLLKEFGFTVKNIDRDRIPIKERVPMPFSDSPDGVARCISAGVAGFSRAYQRSRPDLLLVLGDRFEMFSAVVAALPHNIPVAHLHGGESTEGIIDEYMRHAITKMSHLHFASTRVYANRILRMGEEPWRVQVSGAPSLDSINKMKLFSRSEFQDRYGIPLPDGTLLVTYHPVTLDAKRTGVQMDLMLKALKKIKRPVVFTYPGAETSSGVVIRKVKAFVNRVPSARIAINLGKQGYFSLMKHASAMVGNSSSGIIEAASFKLPVVNIGSRQAGRVRARNVIDAGTSFEEIFSSLELATSAAFRSSLRYISNPYSQGDAARLIVNRLATVNLGRTLLFKHFHETR